jgi:hypothetical protein
MYAVMNAHMVAVMIGLWVGMPVMIASASIMLFPRASSD